MKLLKKIALSLLIITLFAPACSSSPEMADAPEGIKKQPVMVISGKVETSEKEDVLTVLIIDKPGTRSRVTYKVYGDLGLKIAERKGETVRAKGHVLVESPFDKSILVTEYPVRAPEVEK